MRIVIVDDDTAIRTMLAMTASMDGLVVAATFGSVSDAWDWAGWDSVQGAVIDWMMPQANGGVLVDWLADLHPHVTPVVLTAHPAVTHPTARVIAKERMADALEYLSGR